MYDHELSVVMQQERQRAIREAMLHHRYEVQPGPSLRQRLMSAIRRSPAGPHQTADAGGAPGAASTIGRQATGCGAVAAPSRSVPG